MSLDGSASWRAGVASREPAGFMLAFPESAEDEGINRYVKRGFGLYHSEIGGLPVIEHNGGLHGFSAGSSGFRSKSWPLRYSEMPCPASPGRSRPDSQSGRAGHFGRRDAKARHRRPTRRLIRPPMASLLDATSWGGIQVITVENGRIFARYTGQNRFEIFPSGPTSSFQGGRGPAAVSSETWWSVRRPCGDTQNDATSRAARIEEKVTLSGSRTPQV